MFTWLQITVESVIGWTLALVVTGITLAIGSTVGLLIGKAILFAWG